MADDMKLHLGVTEDGGLVEVQDAGSTGYQIDRLYVIVYVDQNGGEGIMAQQTPGGGWMPMVSSKREVIDKLAEMAQQMCNVTGYTARVLEFTTRDVIVKITPDA